MLELSGHLNPRVLSVLVHRYGWRWEGGVREGADRYRNQAVSSFPGVVNRGATCGTEAKPEARSFIPHPNVLAAPARDLESHARETSLLAKYAAGSSLAGKAVAYGYSDGPSPYFYLKLTAGAGSGARLHFRRHVRLRRNV